ncbi:hypothetical protein G5V57_18655 [Nordella sp. HKS 07]|uniref:hypothetical protein n=1 Tax=Nordella sp. HKS 07 TaxID=2712222 RepID=UPI0013E196CF|nr:hypothetical protein [Nordella sp. HKS 07]QIG49553.1 hypothetical protein G5V57_18655 [Nordella sp. HKS 07]
MIIFLSEALNDRKTAARVTLAAAGPVEPQPSPELAPGPTLSSSARKTRAQYFSRRKTPALVNQVRTLYRRGERFSAIARALAVNPDTVRRWLDPEYEDQRRSRTRRTIQDENVLANEEGMLPTLPFVPGITVSGRYRMKRPHP